MRNVSERDKLAYASQSRLIWMKFKKHKLALVGLAVLGALYFVAVFADFIAPYDKDTRFKNYAFTSPSKIRFVSRKDNIIGPYVYYREQELNEETYKYEYVEDCLLP